MDKNSDTISFSHIHAYMDKNSDTISFSHIHLD